MNNSELNHILTQTQESMPSSTDSCDSDDGNEAMTSESSQNLRLLTQEFHDM